MYIKNDEKIYNCTGYSGTNPAVSVHFYLGEEPTLESDEIKLFTSETDANREDILLKTIKRSDYSREVIKPSGEQFILLLTNTPEEDPSADIDNAKENKINELSEAAENKINEGIDFETEDGSKHFSFEAHDQQNLSIICQYLFEHTDIEGHLYHADGEEFKMYARNDLFALRDAMLQHIIECNEKYNTLRTKVNECKTVEEVDTISF